MNYIVTNQFTTIKRHGISPAVKREFVKAGDEEASTKSVLETKKGPKALLLVNLLFMPVLWYNYQR
jgi:hypothetical protein